jgi:hypothetical protein
LLIIADTHIKINNMTLIKYFKNRTFSKFAALVSPSIIMLLFLSLSPLSILRADYPQAEISNGMITARIYLPDPANGYYRSTRFDWSGAIYSLQYKGHEFYGQWFDRVDPNVINWVHQGPEIVSGPCSALVGPVDEFEIPLGWDEAKPGGTFIKIGVGVLRKGEGRYNRYYPYEVLNSGTWTVATGNDSIEFIQKLSDPNSGFAYIYRKVLKLWKDKPVLEIKHSLKNTGKRAIQSSVYNHNFVVLDKQAPGPDFTFRVPFQIQPARVPDKELVEVRGNEVVYMKSLSGEDEAVVIINGFSDNVKDTEIIIENKKVGAGMKISGERPLIRDILWSIRTVLAIEPYIAFNINPGNEFTWSNTIEYYTIPHGN